jgi:hypothetical protein
MSMMASAASKSSPAPTVGVVAVTLPADGYKLRHVWIDEDTLIVGYDPAWLPIEIVEYLIRDAYGNAVIITDGIPA